MSCTQMPRTSSRLEMINMEMSTQNIDTSDDEINSDEISDYYKECHKVYLCIINWLIKNFNSIYGNYLHIYCIIVFEIIFYFNYIVYIEKEEMEKILKMFSSNVEQYFGNYIDNIPINQLDNMKNFCNNLDNNYVYKNNEKLKDNAYDIISTLSIILFITIFLHLRIIDNKIKLLKKTMESIVFIGFIAIFEYYFFNNVVKQYHILTEEQASCYLFENIFIE